MNPIQEKKKRCCSDEEILARKEEILSTATELFAEHGFADANTQDLAERLQVGKGTIFRHFPTKRDLFLAAVDRVMVKMREEILAQIAGVDDGLDQVARGIKAFLSFFANHPEYVELLIQERAQFKDRKRPTYFEHREVNVQRWHLLYNRLIAEGRVREMPVESITDVVGNLIYGTMFTNFFAGQKKPVEQQAQDILEIVFRGILTDQERERLLAALAGHTVHPVVADSYIESLYAVIREATTPMFRRLCAGLMLGAGLAVVAGCGQASSQTGPPPPQEPLVVYDTPITQVVTDYEDFPGRTDAIYTVEVRARVSGYLKKVFFQDGQEVKKNDMLFQIDPRPFQATYDRQKAALEQAEAHAQRLNNEYHRAKILYEQGRSISREEFDRYAFDHAEAEAALSTAKANLDLAKLDLDWTKVTADLPEGVTGRLSRRMVDPGNLIKADETPMTTIVSQDPLYVYFDVHEQAMLRIRRLLQEGKLKAKTEKEVPILISLSDEKDAEGNPVFAPRGRGRLHGQPCRSEHRNPPVPGEDEQPRALHHARTVREGAAADRRPPLRDPGARAVVAVGPGAQEGLRPAGEG